MKRMIGLILLILIISGIGYFAVLNSHNVAVHLYGSFTLQFAAWALILGSLCLGFIFSEARVTLTHPEGWIQRIRHALWKKKDTRRRQRFELFQKACLEGDLRTMEKQYQVLGDDPDMPLYLQAQYLQQLRYFLKPDELIRIHKEALSRNPNQEDLNLAFFRLILSLKDWDQLAGQLPLMKKLLPDHPEVLEGMRQLSCQRQDWQECILLEKRLIEGHADSLLALEILHEHPEHLIRAFRQQPGDAEKWDWGYLKKKLAPSRILNLKRSAEIENFRAAGDFLKASKLCSQFFQETGELEMLQLWEDLFQESGRDSVIVDLLEKLHQSRKKNTHSSLLLAKFYYLQEEYENAENILSKITWPPDSCPELHLILNYLLVQRNQRGHKPPTLMPEWQPDKRLLQIPFDQAFLPGSSAGQLELKGCRNGASKN